MITTKNSLPGNHDRYCKGKVFVVGIGPGGKIDRTLRAEAVIAQCDCIVGYTRYIELVNDLTIGKEIVSTGMMQEKDRCLEAIAIAEGGKNVAVVCSGDPGVYGMAGLIIELAHANAAEISVEIIPGVTAANAAAARLGAPLMLDYAVISLSDLLVPWDSIRKRLNAVAEADLVTILYNPKSQTRTRQLEEAVAIFKSYRSGKVPVGVATAMGTADEKIAVATLDMLLGLEVNMRSVVIIGNSTSAVYDNWFITPRGYEV